MDPKIRLIAIVLAVVLGVVVARNRHHRQDTAAQKFEREHNVSNPGDDPRFKAAEAEARRRWPEFMTAFNHREPNVAYAVKAKFTEGNVDEWMWMQVDSISGNTVRGTIDNDPVDVHNVKLGDHVTKDLSEIDDWVVGRNGSVAQGGFTSKVLKQIDDERKR